jgi:hypothetical protein
VARITYRRKRGTSYQEWHYSRRCTNFPQEDYEVAYSEPHVGRVCRHCERLEKKPKVKQW